MSWLAFTSVDWANRHGEVPEVAEVILRAILDSRFLCLVRPLRNIPLFAIDGFPITFDELYSRLNHPADSNGVDLQIPTLHIGGWYDFSHSTAVNLFCRQAAAGNQDSHLVMGPWTHSSQLPQTQGQVNFGALASAAASRLPELVLAFFRRHLANETVQIPRVKYFLMNAGNWREDRTWPPEAAKPRHLYSGKAGALTDWRPDDESASDQYLYDPDDPTPTVGGRNLGVGCLSSGPISQEALEHRSDLLGYASGAQPGSLDIAGAVEVTLFVSSSAVDTDFIVKLLDLDPGGVALPISEGGLRLRYRSGFDREQAYTPGDTTRLVIPLGHTAWRLLPGHRLALQIQSANFPQLDPNPNTGEILGESAAGTVATNTVFRDRQRASFVQFDVVGDAP